MNTKAILISTLALGTAALGAVIYFTNSSPESPSAPQSSPPAADTGSTLMSTQTASGFQPTETITVPDQAPKQEGYVIKQASDQRSPWAQIMDRMSEFDADGDGILSESERMAMAAKLREEWMEKYDTDADGEISPEEMEAFQVEQFINSEWGQSMMREFDANNDGILSPTEEVALRAHLDDLENQRNIEALAQYDTDGDGTISDTEREVQREQQRQQWASAMQTATDSYDRDGDGVLNIEESQDAWNGWIAKQSLADFRNRYDSNNDGSIGADDYAEFARDFSRGKMTADVNRDGVLNALDHTAFVDLTDRHNNQP